MSPVETASQRLWWKHGVIYQIYPRSFMDSNGDGVGDLAGIRARLPHLAELGVDALWLSPIYPSPMADFGYDVADYCDVDPRFGTLVDFDRLLADAHALGLRVVLDFVPNHTSERHPWFEAARASRADPKRDWFVWRDPAPGGGPPNNWRSIFGGSAWQLDPHSGQYYLHSFLKEQPDLDWRNPEVERAMHGVLRFWLDRGVDGFRIDVIHRIAKDPLLRDEPGPGFKHAENHPDVHAFVRGIRAVLDEYDERMAVGEVYVFDPEQVARYYGRGDELHLAFNFSFLRSPWRADSFRAELERFESVVPIEGWPDVTLSNHDSPRHASRYDHPILGEARARVAAALLLSARGTPFLYYGEELGLRNVPIPTDRLQDPLAHTLNPALSRDPERTPMPWSAAPNGGFTRGEPWLPLGADFAERNVEAQRGDPRSLLSWYRALLALRRATPALERGSFTVLPSPEGVLAFERRTAGSRALVALSFLDEPVGVKLESVKVRGGLRSDPDRALPRDAAAIELGASEAALLVVDDLA